MPPLPNAALPTAADVDAAAQRLAGVALRTPLVASPVLDGITGGRIFLKAEILQRTGSFKFRGAYNKLSSIPEAERGRGVVAFSSGNHAQGVAAAAQLLGMPAVIVMPADAPRPKRERTAALGAEVVLYDRAREDRHAIARDIAQRRHATLVPPYDDPLIIAGQGTIGREIVEDLAAYRIRHVAMPKGGAPAHKGGIPLQSRFDIVQQGVQRTDVQGRQPPPALAGHSGQQRKYRRLGLAAGSRCEQQNTLTTLDRLDCGKLGRAQLGPAQSVDEMVAQGRMQLVEPAHTSNSISSTEAAAAQARSAAVIWRSSTVGA